MSAHETVALEFLEQLAALSGGCAPTERFIMQVLPGDPGDARDQAWRPRAWRPGEPLPASPERTNGYVAISTFGRAPDNTWRRQKALFQSIRCIMIDDVGTKVLPEHAGRLPPTWRVVTSPGNEQWIYVLAGGSPKRELADAVINGLVDQALLPKDERDPGMKGVTRVARVPGFLNGKPRASGPFRVQWAQREGPLYTLEEIVRGYELKGVYERKPLVAAGAPADAKARQRLFNAYVAAATRLGLVRSKANLAQWIEVSCPWADGHTNSRGGADLREPAVENEWWGAFKCHHGHCEQRGWGDFTRHIDEHIDVVGRWATALDAANAAAPSFEEVTG